MPGLATLGVNQSIATTFGGTIADGQGQLALNLGGGTLTLTGTNTYTGGTTVSGDAELIATSPNWIDPTDTGNANLFVGSAFTGGGNPFGTVQTAAASSGGVSAVPEPGTLALLAASVAAAAWVRRLDKRTRWLRRSKF